MSKRYHLYFDDTGSREPDHKPDARDDSMNCFALGGVLIKEEDVDAIYAAHKAFCKEWRVDYPLHSSSIRGGRGHFGWLRKPENAGEFLPALEDFLLSLPVTGIACVVNRPGYLSRYMEKHRERLWMMCKTAFQILVERSAKFADADDRLLEVYYEESGKREDRDITRYMRELKMSGSFFSDERSDEYEPLQAGDYKRIIMGEPRRKTKRVPMIQVGDLYLYPMAKGGYDPEYRPYKRFMEYGKLIDCGLSEKELPMRGIKYSCFDA